MSRTSVLRILAYALVFAAGFVGVHQIEQAAAEQLYRNQLEACRDNNVLRTQINVRSEAQRDFITNAIKTRLASAAKAATPAERRIDLTAVDAYRFDRSRYTQLPLVPCHQRVDAP